MARCPPSCKLGGGPDGSGGSSRRRAQSPFVRRNKERHCVFFHGWDAAGGGASVRPVPGMEVPWVRERGSGATLGRNRTFATGRTGAPDGLGHGYYTTSPDFRGLKGLFLHVTLFTMQWCPSFLSPVVRRCWSQSFYSASIWLCLSELEV